MGYPDNVLAADERVVLHRHPHWKRLIGPVLILIFAVRLSLLPAQGMVSLRAPASGPGYFLDVGKHLVLPVFCVMLYYLAVVPTGLVMRALGKDPLRLRKDPAATSYWIPHASSTSVAESPGKTSPLSMTGASARRWRLRRAGLTKSCASAVVVSVRVRLSVEEFGAATSGMPGLVFRGVAPWTIESVTFAVMLPAGAFSRPTARCTSATAWTTTSGPRSKPGCTPSGCCAARRRPRPPSSSLRSRTRS